MLKLLLSRARKFFEPCAFETAVYYDDHAGRMLLEFTSCPRVVLIMDRALRQWDPGAPSLEELRYGKYDRDPCMRAEYYARRPWLWLLRAGVWVRGAYWRLLNATHGRLWHTPLDHDGFEFHWRDVRLGSGALETARADAASLRMRVDKLSKKAAELAEQATVAHTRGFQTGWDQHKQAVERLLSEELD